MIPARSDCWTCVLVFHQIFSMRSGMRVQNSQKHSGHEGGPCSRQTVTFSKADFCIILVAKLVSEEVPAALLWSFIRGIAVRETQGQGRNQFHSSMAHSLATEYGSMTNVDSNSFRQREQAGTITCRSWKERIRTTRNTKFSAHSVNRTNFTTLATNIYL